MSYIERSMVWFFKNRVIKGFSILANSKFLFYSLMALIWIVLAPISLALYNFLGEALVLGILKMEVAIILSFFISGVIINFVDSLKVRLLITISVLSVITVLIEFVLPIGIQYYFPVIGGVVFAGALGIALFIIVRTFNTSWISRMMMVGKSSRKIFMHNVSLFINAISILAPIFLVVRFFLGFGTMDLILGCLGFVTWGIVMYATTHFSSHFAYDIYASILSGTYFIVVILFLMYVGSSTLALILDVLLLALGLSALVQTLYSRRKTEQVSVYVPKSTTSPEDSTITIIQDDEPEESLAEGPTADEDEYVIEQETTEVRSSYDGVIVIVLGLILSFHFLVLQLIGDLVISAGFITLPFGFSLATYHLMLLLLGYCLVISIYLAFKLSYRFRGYTTKTMSEQAAFFKFLLLINEEDRKRFLQRLSKTVRDILVGAVQDLIDGERSRWREGFEKSRKFFRRLFGTEE